MAALTEKQDVAAALDHFSAADSRLRSGDQLTAFKMCLI